MISKINSGKPVSNSIVNNSINSNPVKKLNTSAQSPPSAGTRRSYINPPSGGMIPSTQNPPSMEARNTNTSMKNTSSKSVQMKAISTETQSQNNKVSDLQGVIQRKDSVITIEQFLLAGGAEILALLGKEIVTTIITFACSPAGLAILGGIAIGVAGVALALLIIENWDKICDLGGFIWDGICTVGNSIKDTAEDFINWMAGGPDRPGKMQKEVEKGQAPRDVDRVDEGHAGGKPHVHLKDGTAMNNDGTIHDKKGGTPNPSNKVKDWLKKHGWKDQVVKTDK